MKRGNWAAIAVWGLSASLAWCAGSEVSEGDARQAVAARNFGQARKLYATLTLKHPENPEYWTWLGRVSGYLGDYQASLAAYDQALQIAPRDVDTLVGRAYTLLWRRDYETASSTLALAGEINPQSSDVALANARLHFYQRRLPEALHYVRKALRLNPQNQDASALQEQLLPRHSVRLETGISRELFSFARPGTAGFLEAGWVSPSDAISVRFESWNRFGQKLSRGGLRYSHTFHYRWTVEGAALAGGRGDVLARHDDSLGLRRRFGSGWSVSTSYRSLLFDQSRVQLISPGIEYSFERPITVEFNYYRAWTSSSARAGEQQPAHSMLLRYNQRFGKVAAHAGWGRGTELVTLPAADQAGRFGATTYLGGAAVPLARRLSLQGEYVLRRRSSGALERMILAGIVVQK